jgi:3-dehydroquinate synthase
MKTITVTASKTYEVMIGPDLLASAGALASELVKGLSAAIVTDDIVGPLYRERLAASLKKAGFRVVSFVVRHGEASKNAENYFALLNFLAEERFTRGDTVFALGGGVVGDLSGFAASTYMRGLRLVQLPTTLLAAVDSSVGGKTAIDLIAGKNLAGTFYQPDLVLCDTSALATLPGEILTDGVAEVIKYGVLADEALFHMLKDPVMPRLEEIIARCVAIKRDIVQRDETETGPRKLLNFGHTVGHAVEALSNYAISHGRAVAVGMAVVARASSKKGLCTQDTAEQIVNLIGSFDLPTATEYSAARLAGAALHDKKRSGGSITLVVPEAIGRCVLRETPVSALEEFIGLGL